MIFLPASVNGGSGNDIPQIVESARIEIDQIKKRIEHIERRLQTIERERELMRRDKKS